MIFVLAGLLLIVAAISCLYRGWSVKGRAGLPFTIAGWLTLVAAVCVMSIGAGTRFAVAFAFIAISLSAWLLIVAVRTRRQRTRINSAKRDTINWRGVTTSLVPQLIKAIVFVPVCGTLAGLITVGATHLLPFERVDNIALGIYAMPLVWAALAIWYMAATNPPRLYIGFVILATCSAISVYA